MAAYRGPCRSIVCERSEVGLESIYSAQLLWQLRMKSKMLKSSRRNSEDRRLCDGEDECEGRVKTLGRKTELGCGYNARLDDARMRIIWLKRPSKLPGPWKTFVVADA